MFGANPSREKEGDQRQSRTDHESDGEGRADLRPRAILIDESERRASDAARGADHPRSYAARELRPDVQGDLQAQEAREHSRKHEGAEQHRQEARRDQGEERHAPESPQDAPAQDGQEAGKVRSATPAWP